MNTADSFYNNIAKKMDDGPLRRLVVDMHRILFLHPECPGACISIEGNDPLVLRNNLEEAIVAALLALMEQYRREALVVLSATETTTAVRAKKSTGPSKKRKLKAAPETLTIKTRSMTRRSQPKN
ncbi:hypothetical protein GGI16_001255 [Coemansia sp. S142-1]|nr:hypothetical protein GGI16_001255 [Coemansia sp. S142-1]